MASGYRAVAVPPDQAPVQTAASAVVSATDPSLAASKVAPDNSINGAWFSGFTSSNVYREVVKLRDSRKPGAYGAGLRLLLPCAGLSVMNNPRSDPLVKAVDSANYQMRLQAKDRLIAYCSQISGGTLVEFLEPPIGDVFAAQYTSAVNTLDTAMVKSKEENRRALEELARQGLLSIEKNYILMNLKLNGQALSFPNEEASAAFDIAALRATSYPGMASKDIRIQLRCWTGGSCDESYDAVSSRFSEAQRQKILALAAEMEPALRKGDVSGLIGPP